MIQRYDIEKAMSSVSLIISVCIFVFSFLHSSPTIIYNILLFVRTVGLRYASIEISKLGTYRYTSIFLVKVTSIFRMLYLCKKRCMKDVLKISILLILALSNGALFAQTNRSLNLNRDTLDIKFVKDTLVTSTIQDTLAAIPAVKDSITAKQDEINDSALYYRLILHYRDSVNHNLKRIYNKDAFKFKDDYFREKMREPWIGDVLKRYIF